MYTLHTPSEFLEDLIKHIQKAEKHVYIQTMNFEEGVVINRLEKVMIDAARRGVKVIIHHDWIAAHFIHDDLPLLPVFSSEKRKEADRLQDQYSELHARLKIENIEIEVMNVPPIYTRLLKPAGRNHIKMYIVDAEVAWIGGVNLFDKAFETIDFMIKTTSKKLIELLSEQFFLINQNRRKNDYKVQISDEYSLYVDAGKYGTSMIYDHAVEMVSQTENHALFMSQFLPDYKILDHLVEKANQGKSIYIVTSPEDNGMFHTYPYKFFHDRIVKRIKKYPSLHLLYLDIPVHAKLIYVDGKVAFLGSHNFISTGVFLGTEEISLEIKDKKILNDLVDYLRSLSITL